MPYNLLVLMTAISMVTCNESIINNKCKGNCVVQTFSNVPQKSSLIQILFKKILVWFFISLVLRLYFHLAFYPLKIVWHFGASFTTQLNILWGINHLLNNVYHFLCKNNQAITSSLCTHLIRISWSFLLQYASLYIFFLPHFYSNGRHFSSFQNYFDFSFKLFKSEESEIQSEIKVQLKQILYIFFIPPFLS